MDEFPVVDCSVKTCSHPSTSVVKIQWFGGPVSRSVKKLLGFHTPSFHIWVVCFFCFWKKNSCWKHFWDIFGNCLFVCSLGKRTTWQWPPVPTKNTTTFSIHLLQYIFTYLSLFWGVWSPDQKTGRGENVLAMLRWQYKAPNHLVEGKTRPCLAYVIGFLVCFLHQLLLKGFPIHLNCSNFEDFPLVIKLSPHGGNSPRRNMAYWRFRPPPKSGRSNKKKLDVKISTPGQWSVGLCSFF